MVNFATLPLWLGVARQLIHLYVREVDRLRTAKKAAD
jgi:hypothetical protein